MKPRGKESPLGKGLSALLPAIGSERVPKEISEKGPFMECPIDAIQPNPYQPRTFINGGDLEGLAASIKEKGILQPLVVRKVKENSFELIAGERRLRAAKMAGLIKVPVLLRDVSDPDRLELALIENIQRENLNCLEEAESYQRLIAEFGHTQEEIAQRVGKERSTITNSLRILRLPDFVKKDLIENVLSPGHARALLGLESEEDLYMARQEIVGKKLNVRQAEELVKRIKKRKLSRPRKVYSSMGLTETQCQSFARQISNNLGAKSRIVQKGVRGRVEIEYKSPSDLERLLDLIGRKKDNTPHDFSL